MNTFDRRPRVGFSLTLGIQRSNMKTGLDIRGTSADSLLFSHACTQEMPYDLQVHKKFKSSSIRKWISSAMKGRRKEKDSSLSADEPTPEYLADDLVQHQLIHTDFNQLVELPQGIDYNEWLATHTLSFFEHMNLMYGAVSEFCSSTACQTMAGPANTQYVWEDLRGKKCKYPAPQYVDYVMTFSQKYVQDENVFPTKYGVGFPSGFEVIVKKIYRLLFQVLAHIYHAHYKHILHMKLHSHLNTLAVHFLTFAHHHGLLVEFKDTDCLSDLHAKLLHACHNHSSPCPTRSPSMDIVSSPMDGAHDSAQMDVEGTGLDSEHKGLSPPKDSSGPETALCGEENKENLALDGNMPPVSSVFNHSGALVS